MNIGKRLLQMACLVLVISFLVGCGTSQATPTPLPVATTLPEPTQAPPEPTEAPPEPTATQVEPTATPIPPTPTPTQVFTLVTSAEEIVGTWLGFAICIRFYEDGTFNKALSLDKLDSHPYAVSKFWFEGTQMFIEEISVSGVPSCGRKIGIYEIRLLEDDNIQISTIKDQCSQRVNSTGGIYQPVH
jgi:hypothetical protein